MTPTTKPMDDGGFAFPWGEHGTRLGGLSMRDYFAAKAMQALLSRQPDPLPAAQWFQPGHEMEDARQCYVIADAMIRARQENSNG